LTALPRFLLAALSLLLARLLLSAAALLAALATLLAALSRLLARLLLSGAALLAALLAWLFIRVHNCSFVSSLPTTKPRPLSFLRTLVRKRTIRPVESRGVKFDRSQSEWGLSPVETPCRSQKLTHTWNATRLAEFYRR
jgi:hypothetical protein